MRLGYRVVRSRHCRAPKCWCESRTVFVSEVDSPRPQPIYMVEDEKGGVWRVPKALIRKHTEDWPDRWKRLLDGVGIEE